MESTQKMDPISLILAGVVLLTLVGSILWMVLEGGAVRKGAQQGTTQSSETIR